MLADSGLADLDGFSVREAGTRVRRWASPSCEAGESADESVERNAIWEGSV